MEIKTQKVSIALWHDIERLFSSSNGCDDCWCMNHRLKPEDEVKGEAAKTALRTCIQEGKAHGILAYVEGRPAGWCAFDQRMDLLGHDCTYPVEGQATWSIHCLYVHPDFRNKGISHTLIESALEIAKQYGAKIIESYPMPEDRQEAIPTDRSFSGRISTFRKAGFQLTEKINDFYTRMTKQIE